MACYRDSFRLFSSQDRHVRLCGTSVKIYQSLRRHMPEDAVTEHKALHFVNQLWFDHYFETSPQMLSLCCHFLRYEFGAGFKLSTFASYTTSYYSV
jgi:hypothetical protein